MEAHQRLFPNCAFIRGEYCGNMPFEIDPDINSTPSSSSNRTHCQAAMAADSAPPGKKLYSKSNLPDFPRLADPLSRSQTFLSPNWKSTAVSVEDLVDAGFFYTRKCILSFKLTHQLSTPFLTFTFFFFTSLSLSFPLSHSHHFCLNL